MTFHDLLRDWHARELATDYGLQGKLVTGYPLWGPGYVADWLAYCLPSMMANDMADSEIVIYVDAAAELALQGIRFPVLLRRLPDAIMAMLYESPGYKYPLLAGVHNLLVHKAGEAGAGFHMSTSDAIYSENYFRNLMRLAETHEAVVHTGFAFDPWNAMPLIEAYRRGDALPIPAADLGAIGWKYLNPQWASWTMDTVPEDFSAMPNSHWIHWRGQRSVRIHSAHQSPVWIGPERCKGVAPNFGGTLDSELPRYVAGDFHTPTLADDMAYVVIGGSNPTTPQIDWETFKREFWMFIGDNKAFLPFFRSAVHVPVPFDAAAPSDDVLDARFREFITRLEDR